MTGEILIIILEILKYFAIAIGSILGILAIKIEPRDKITNKINNWGKFCIVLIIVSGLFAILAQSIESYLEMKSENASKNERQKSQDSLNSIVHSANKALIELSRLTHPIEGDLTVSFVINYPIVEGPYGIKESNWLKRIEKAMDKKWLIINDKRRELEPDTLLGERKEYHLLKKTDIQVFINKIPVNMNKGDYSKGSGDLIFMPISHKTDISIHLDTENKVVEHLKCRTTRYIDNNKIISYSDLYNSEIILVLPDGAPHGLWINGMALQFGNGQTIFIEFDETNRRVPCDETKLNEYCPSIFYSKILTEKDLGKLNDL